MDDRGESPAFLFSDIEASTRRWESDPDAMARDLALHDELIGHALPPEEAIKRALANLPTRSGPRPTPSVALP